MRKEIKKSFYEWHRIAFIIKLQIYYLPFEFVMNVTKRSLHRANKWCVKKPHRSLILYSITLRLPIETNYHACSLILKKLKNKKSGAHIAYTYTDGERMFFLNYDILLYISKCNKYIDIQYTA